MVDTGADVSVIDTTFIIKHKVTTEDCNLKLLMANKTTQTIDKLASINLKCGEKSVDTYVRVMPLKSKYYQMSIKTIQKVHYRHV